MSDYKINAESAELEYERFMKAMDLREPRDADSKDAYEALKYQVVEAIMVGSLVIAENGEPTYTPTRTEGIDPITFHEPTGADLMAMDRVKDGHDVGKQNAILAAVTRTNAGLFAKLKSRDYKVCKAIITIFLA